MPKQSSPSSILRARRTRANDDPTRAAAAPLAARRLAGE